MGGSSRRWTWGPTSLRSDARCYSYTDAARSTLVWSFSSHARWNGLYYWTCVGVSGKQHCPAVCSNRRYGSANSHFIACLACRNMDLRLSLERGLAQEEVRAVSRLNSDCKLTVHERW